MDTRLTGIAGFCLAVFLPLTAFGAPQLSGTPDELQQYLNAPVSRVTISAQAEESAYSDIAKITLLLTTSENELEAAIAANGDLRDRIRREFIAAGIPADKVNTARFSTSPQFGWFGDKPRSYEVANRMRIEVSEESQLKAVAAAVDSSAEIALTDIEFEHSAKQETEELVLGKALDEVLRQKAFYEERLGFKLVATGVSRNQVRPMPRRAYARQPVLEERLADSGGMAAEVGYDSPAVTFDEIKYTASVAVNFDVERPQ